jgi:DNA-binding beta-propeller fold protein YncE
MVNSATFAAAARLPPCRALLVGLRALGATGTSLRAQEESGSAGAWEVVAGDQTGPGQFDSPFGVAVDPDGSIYVADTGNQRIQKLAPTGEPLAQWGGKGKDPGQFARPEGVAVDGEGNVYVADTENHRIQKLSPAGESLAQWGSLGHGPGQFQSPSGVAVDGEGNLYVADIYNRRVQKLVLAGRT